MVSRRRFLKYAGAVGGLAVATAAIGPIMPKAIVEGKDTAPLQSEQQQVTWVKSLCTMCNAADAIRVQVVNGVPVKIEGEPADKLASNGKICAKGIAGIWTYHDPYRLKKPLKRVGPKGSNTAPDWVEISWDEAYTTIAEKLKAVRAKGREGTAYFSNTSAIRYSGFYAPFKSAAVGPRTDGGIVYNVYMNMNMCGEVCHYINRLAHGAFSSRVDFKYCNYIIHTGYSNGYEGGHGFIPHAYRVADARARGMKVIDLDPRQGIPGAKADEWYPVFPATEGAFADAVLNVLLNELNIYDAAFIKKYTNGPYLVGSNGYFVRDKNSQKPMVWDSVEKKAKPYDDVSIKDYALTGEYDVGGVAAKPSFQLLVESVKTFTPEWAEGITGISAMDTRRIATEFAAAAQIGSTIVIDGKTWPYRPAAFESYASNAANHVHGTPNGWSVLLANTIIGNVEVPGGPMHAWYDMFQKPGKDGMIAHPATPYGPQLRNTPAYAFEYPPEATLDEFYPHGDTANMAMIAMNNPDKYGGGTRRKIEFMFHFANNGMLAMYDQPQMEKLWAAAPFNVDIELVMNENAQAYADIVLPDRCYLEKYYIGSPTDAIATTQPRNWLQQPAGDPALPDVPDAYDIFQEIAKRGGFLYGKDGYYDWINRSLIFNPRIFPDINTPHKQEEWIDAWCKASFGLDKGLEWAKKNGGNRPVAVTPYMTYATMLDKVYRLPIYVEEHKRSADELKANMDKHGVQWNYEDYFTLPTWIPSHIQQDTPPYDLVAMCYLQPMHAYTWSQRIPWLGEMSVTQDPYASYVWMNSKTAKERGISDGDWIWVESEIGKARGRARLSEVIHPKVIAINRSMAGWAGSSITKRINAEYSPIAYMTIRPNKLEYTEKLSGALENLFKVRVYKA